MNKIDDARVQDEVMFSRARGESRFRCSGSVLGRPSCPLRIDEEPTVSVRRCSARLSASWGEDLPSGAWRGERLVLRWRRTDPRRSHPFLYPPGSLAGRTMVGTLQGGGERVQDVACPSSYYLGALGFWVGKT